MSSDFGGAVRAGAGVAVDDGMMMTGEGDGIGTTICVVDGATQSSGCTTVFPVIGSYEMMRTPDCAAHASSSFVSDGASVSP